MDDAVSEREPTIVTMELRICTLCLDGKEGECHSPGCMFWMCPAISAEQAERLRGWAFADIAAANRDVFS